MILKSKLKDAPPMTYNYLQVKNILYSICCNCGGTLPIEDIYVEYYGTNNLLLRIEYNKKLYGVYR